MANKIGEYEDIAEFIEDSTTLGFNDMLISYEIKDNLLIAVVENANNILATAKKIEEKLAKHGVGLRTSQYRRDAKTVTFPLYRLLSEKESATIEKLDTMVADIKEKYKYNTADSIQLALGVLTHTSNKRR